MGTFNPSQTSFINGAISPRLEGMVGSDLLKAAVREALNWQLTSWHSALLAPGSTFKRLAAAAKRVVAFRRNGQQDQHLVMGGGTAGLFDQDGAQRVLLTGINLVANGDFSGGTSSWPEYTSAPFGTGHSAGVTGRLELTPDINTATLCGRYQVLTLAAPTILTLAYRFGEIATPRAFNSSGKVLLQDSASYHGGTPGTFVYADLNCALGRTSVQLNGGLALPAGTYYLFLVSFGGQFWFDDIEITSGSSIQDIQIPWSDDQLPDVHLVSETGTDRTIFFHPNVAPWFLQRAATGTWAFGPAPFANIPPLDPANPAGPPLWAGSTWPATGELWQGRLYVGGVPGQGNRLMASKVGSPFDFGLTVPDPTDGSKQVVTAVCGLNLQLSTKGAIQWLRGRFMLLVGTDLGEGALTAGSSAGGAVSPTDFQYRDESAFGCSSVQTELAGDEVLYLSRNRQKLRAIDYQLAKQGWLSSEVTWAAEHLTAASPIAEIHYAKEPHPTILARLDDGTLACCTYDREKKQAAWWTRTTPGTILSLAVSHGPSGAVVMLLVQRGASTCLERLPMSELDAEAGYLDSAVALSVGVVLPTLSPTTDLLYYGAAPTSPAGGFAVGSYLTFMETGVGLGGLAVTGPGPVDVVFTDGGRARVDRTEVGASSCNVTISEPLSDAVKAALVTLPPTLAGGVDWRLEPATVYSGYDHLEGQTVQVQVDGSLDDDQVVVGGSVSVTAAPKASLVVGLPRTHRLRTLRLEGGLQEGSSQVAPRRYMKVRLRLNNSALPLVNGERAPERAQTDLMDRPPEPVTGDVDSWEIGWEEDGALEITQDVPLRTEVLAIFGKAHVNEV